MCNLRRLCHLAVLAAGLALQAVPATAERRVALVIGNSAYEHTSALPNPRNDAEDLAAALRRLEFEVLRGLDLNKRDMERLIREFTGKLAGVDVALFFYAGHSLQLDKQNFMMPVDARLASEADVDFETIPLTLVLRHMQLDAKTNLVFLDACRDNPLASGLSRRIPARSSFFGRGLAQVEASGFGTLIGFSTQPNNVALDGTGRNSPYAAALLSHMEIADTDIAVVMRQVRNQVLQATNRRQVPWEHSSLTEQFIFRRVATKSAATTARPPPTLPAQPVPPREDAEAWASIKETTSIAVLEAFLKRFPSGMYAEFARARLQELKIGSTGVAERPVQAPPPPPPQQNEQAMAWSTIKDTSSVSVLEAFLARYPTGIYAELARARLQELKQLQLAKEREREREQRAKDTADARDRQVQENLARERAVREKEARDREALEREAREKEARERKAREQIALLHPSQPRGEALHSDAVSRIAAWIERDFLKDNIAYAALVDWYDQGTIGRDAVLKDRAKYMARWPERHFALIPGSMQITAAGANRYSATFELTYAVRSAARNAQTSGKSRIMIDVEMIDGLPHVARQRETTGR